MKKSLSIILITLSAVLASCSRGDVGGSSFFSSLSSSSSSESEKSDQPRSLRPGQPQTIEEPVSRPKRRVASVSAKKVIGGILSNPISQTLNASDKQAASAAEFRALEFGKTGVATPWRNPSNGRYGNVVASKPFRQKNIYCRQYTHTIYLSGRPEISNGIACRNKDGSWQNLGSS